MSTFGTSERWRLRTDEYVTGVKPGLSPSMCSVRALVLLLHVFGIYLLVQADSATPHVPRCATEAFTKPQVGRGITILSVHAQPQINFTSSVGGPLLPALEGLDFCQIQVYLTHQTKADVELHIEGTDDRVLVEIWLPMTADDWNGRFQATGGAAFATGMFGAHLGVAVKNGWAAVSTDGGHDADLAKRADASWATSGPNRSLLHNFASRSAIDQVMVGKDITRQYFGTEPHHSYWNGCSTGGRQGYAVAQKYPELLDGILANAPALSFVNLLMGELWPQLVMKDRKILLSNCELEHFRWQAISSCQGPEDVDNGMLEDPSDCNWATEEMVGQKIECDGQVVLITDAMAEVVQRILDGPAGAMAKSQFPGLPLGASMTTLANTTTSGDGSRSLSPFAIAASFLRHVVSQDARLDVKDLDINSFNALWISAQYELGGLLNTDDPDLTRLRDSGTKMLTWHGINDQMIPYKSTVNYRRKVEAAMGGAHAVDQYYRLFLAPGVEHCGGGIGPVPQDPLDALVQWVEHNEAPEVLDASIIDHEGYLVTKELCLWPAKAKYLGIGDPKRASSWTCQDGTERPAAANVEPEPWAQLEYGEMQQSRDGKKAAGQQGPGRTGQILGGLKDRIEGLGLGLRAE